MDTDDHTALKLKALRERAHLGPSDMARLLGMKYSSYMHYENPTRMKDGGLKVPFARRIAAVLAPYGIAEADVMALADPDAHGWLGLSEDAPAFIPSQAIAVPPDAALIAALAPKVRRPMMFQMTRPVPSFRISPRDRLIIDQDNQGDGLVIVTLWGANGEGVTVLRRKSENRLVSSDIDDEEPVIEIDGSPRVGVLGRVVAVARFT